MHGGDIHVAADFRLREGSASGRLISDKSAKIIVLHEQDWSGIVTYCGVGRAPSIDTAMLLADWLKHDDGTTFTFAEVVQRLEDVGSSWLRRFAPGYRHAFVAAAILSKGPYIALISNYRELSGKQTSQLPRLRSEIRRVASSTILVTGQERALGREDRNVLLALAKSGTDAHVLRRRMAAAIERASLHPAAGSTISRSCLAYSLLRHGSAEGSLHGDVTGKFNPPVLIRGQDPIAPHVAQFGPNAQLIHTHHATNTSEEAPKEQCDKGVASSEPGSELYQLSELEGLGGGHAEAVACSESGLTIGTSTRTPGGQIRAVSWIGTEPVELPIANNLQLGQRVLIKMELLSAP